MATSAEKLANSLEALETFRREGRTCLRSRDLGRTNRERLVRNGFLHEVMKGWYFVSCPDQGAGESTAWDASYWRFAAEYLTARFGDEWCVSPVQSLLLHAGNWAVPRQLLVRASGASNRPVQLLHGTTILDSRQALPDVGDQQIIDGIRVYAPEVALVAVPASFFVNNPVDARATLAKYRDAGQILSRLLGGGRTAIAGRLAGAFRNIGADGIAEDILGAMRAAGHEVRESDPFEDRLENFVFRREPSPYVHRIKLMWNNMREDVIGRLPVPPAKRTEIAAYLGKLDDIYVTDAYHSLSMEGYRVTRELIDRVRSVNWNLECDKADRKHIDTMAAFGYYQCFLAVKHSVERVLKGEDSGKVADGDHAGWYRQMFGPSVKAGLIEPVNLEGYRNSQVYIRGSRHRPLNVDAVRDTMPTFFELLMEENDPAVRIVLGHFIFVYIHPYMDGNGRMGRFLMNVMLAAGGYDWMIIPVERRSDYMRALEAASIDQNIVPFADFLAEQVRNPTR